MPVLGEVVEQSSFIYRVGFVTEETEVPIPLNQITALTLTWKDDETGSVINTREDQDVLNLNDVVVTDGELEWSGQIEDSVIVGSPVPGDTECHTATFKLAYGLGSQLTWSDRIEIKQLEAVI